MTLRFDYARIVSEGSIIPNWPGPPLPVVAVDECCDHPEIARLIAKLVQCGLACGADPLWNQKRIAPDGSQSYWLGGLSRQTASILGECSRPAKGFSWDDQNVVMCLVARLFLGVPIVLLSENIKNDTLGLRRLLRQNVEPALTTRIRDGLSLTAVFKKGKTSYPEYCALVHERFKLGEWEPGYREYLL